jgi:membrane-associated phospholipid phosphatase
VTSRASRRGPAVAAILATLAAIALSIAYLDRPLAYWAHGLDPGFIAICARLTLLGDSKWYLVPLGLAVPALYLAAARSPDPSRAAALRRMMWTSVFLFAAIAVSGLLVDLLKIVFGRARPILLFREGDAAWHFFSLKPKLHGFPSGHANTFVALAFALGLLRRRFLFPLLVLAALLSLTRIAVAEHYLSDLIAGGGLAIATTLWLRGVFARRGLVFQRADEGVAGARRIAH